MHERSLAHSPNTSLVPVVSVSEGLTRRHKARPGGLPCLALVGFHVAVQQEIKEASAEAPPGHTSHTPT